MSTTIKLPEMDEGCTHLEGYSLGFRDAHLQMVDQINSLSDIKAEYDRAFCVLRDAGIDRDDTKKLSTALSMLILKFEKVLKLQEKNVKRYAYLRSNFQYGVHGQHRLEWYLPSRLGSSVSLAIQLDTHIDDAIKERGIKNGQ